MNDAKARPAFFLLGCLALALAPYFIGLGSSSLWDSNEAFYAETPREMIESGDYVNPSFNYQPRFNKPPLSYWVVAASYKVFGVTEWAERLPIAFGALVMVATAYAFGRIAFSPGAGVWAATALASSPRLLMFSRRIFIDVYVSMFVGLAVLFFSLSVAKPERRRTWLLLMYVSIGLAVLTKGPVGFLLPALAIAGYVISRRKQRWSGGLMLPAGALIVCAIVVPWYAMVYFQHGWNCIASFLIRDNVSRYAGHAWGPVRGIFFYVPVLLGDLFPASIFVPPALWFGARAVLRRPANDVSNGSRDVVLILLLTVAITVLFFSISRSKEDLYILPSYSAAAALAGGLIWRFANRDVPAGIARLTRVLLVGGGLLVSAAGVMAAWAFSGNGSEYALSGARIIGATGAAGGLACVALCVLDRRGLAIGSLLFTIAAANWIFVVRTLPDFERYKPVQALCRIITSEAEKGALTGYYRIASPSMVFYLKKPIFEYYDPADLRDALGGDRQVFCLITESDYLAMRDSLAPRMRVLASRPVFQVKLRGILDRVTPPQVLLISNSLE